jgi:hypothetical protein
MLNGAEHGGFAHDDVNVILLMSTSGFSPSTVTSPVEAAQIAPTLLTELGKSPTAEGRAERGNPGPARPRFLTRRRNGAPNSGAPSTADDEDLGRRGRYEIAGTPTEPCHGVDSASLAVFVWN